MKLRNELTVVSNDSKKEDTNRINIGKVVGTYIEDLYVLIK